MFNQCRGGFFLCALRLRRFLFRGRSLQWPFVYGFGMVMFELHVRNDQLPIFLDQFESTFARAAVYVDIVVLTHGRKVTEAEGLSSETAQFAIRDFTNQCLAHLRNTTEGSLSMHSDGEIKGSELLVLDCRRFFRMVFHCGQLIFDYNRMLGGVDIIRGVILRMSVCGKEYALLEFCHD